MSAIANEVDTVPDSGSWMLDLELDNWLIYDPDNDPTRPYKRDAFDRAIAEARGPE